MDIGGSCTWTADDPETFFYGAGPTANTPRAGANFTTFTTNRLSNPPYSDSGCFTITAAIPAGGTAADQRAIIEGALSDKIDALRLELQGGGTLVPGINGFSWLEGPLKTDRTKIKTTCFALKSNNTGAPGAQEIVVSVMGVTTTSGSLIEEATAIATAQLIGLITMPS